MPAKSPRPASKVVIPQTSLTATMQSNMRRFIITVVAVTVLIVIIGGYFIWSLAGQNVKAANKIKAQDIYMKLAQEKIDNLSEAETKLATLKRPESNGVSYFELVTERALPESDDLGIILTTFQKLETNTLIKLENISKLSSAEAARAAKTAAPTSSNGAKSFALSFKATGTYEQIQKFLKSLESSTRVFDFSSLKISGQGTKTSIDMSYRLYYLPLPSLADKEVPIDQYLKEGAK